MEFEDFHPNKKIKKSEPTTDDDSNNIEIRGAYENNLKYIDVSIPKRKLVVFAGISGSGKSSLVFDILAVESNRQWQQSYSSFIRNKLPHYERPKVLTIKNLTPAIIVDQKAFGSNPRSTVGTAVDVAPLIRLLFSRIGEPSAGSSMYYSFNHPLGMCHECTGIGEKLVLNEDSLFDVEKSLKEGGIKFSLFSHGWQTCLYQSNPLLNPNKKLKDFTEEEWDILKYGSKKPVKVYFVPSHSGEATEISYEGVIPRFHRLYLKKEVSKSRKTLYEEIKNFVQQGPCYSCHGTGLNPRALASKILGYNILDFNTVSVKELLIILKKIDCPVGVSIVNQISYILEKMIDVGLGYLSLGRKTDSLSGGEAQRIKMVRNLGSGLSDITYIFDEPTSGLHPYDAEKIGNLLIHLRNNHNNVLVVEHSKQMINLADHIIELGPKAGSGGGKIVYQGDLKEMETAMTPTALALNEKLKLNDHPLPWSQSFLIENAKLHNLKNITVEIPKGILTAITGVAGSGKSSLCQEFARKNPEAIVIHQRPIGTTNRSNPATYTGIMDDIRKEFAIENGVSPSLFSFNSNGACPLCKGKGQISYEMAFADSVKVKCEECNGHRYSKKVLTYKYKGKNIEEVMALTIEDALKFFDKDSIKKPIKSLLDVGLGYLTLGQSTSSLSGGELQRIKLANELNKRGNVYILDEPSTGLHSKDIQRLLAFLRRLVNNHNTVVIVEHRVELIAQTDYIIDMGPEGGSDGGQIIFKGTPQEIINCKNSKTGKYLKHLIS